MARCTLKKSSAANAIPPQRPSVVIDPIGVLRTRLTNLFAKWKPSAFAVNAVFGIVEFLPGHGAERRGCPGAADRAAGDASCGVDAAGSSRRRWVRAGGGCARRARRARQRRRRAR